MKPWSYCLYSLRAQTCRPRLVVCLFIYTCICDCYVCLTRHCEISCRIRCASAHAYFNIVLEHVMLRKCVHLNVDCGLHANVARLALASLGSQGESPTRTIRQPLLRTHTPVQRILHGPQQCTNTCARPPQWWTATVRRHDLSHAQRAALPLGIDGNAHTHTHTHAQAQTHCVLPGTRLRYHSTTTTNKLRWRAHWCRMLIYDHQSPHSQSPSC
jgi:hypothetical protein